MVITADDSPVGEVPVTSEAASSAAGAATPHRAACRNCGMPLQGPYCAHCGQRDTDLERPLRELVGEWLAGVAAFDNRLLATLWRLLLRPGLLTREYLAGRRVRYVEPVKLYLAISLVVFVVLQLSGATMVRTTTGNQMVAPITIREIAPSPPGAIDSAGAAENGPPVGSKVPEAERGLLTRATLRLVDQFERDPDGFNRRFLQQLARSLFVLLPAIAVLLRGLYRRSRFVHQVVFALHLQSFVFLALLLRLALQAVGADVAGALLLAVGVPTWLYLALRSVHGEGRARTAAKTAVLVVAGLVTLVATLLATAVVTALTA